jgi:hypothetical protein
MRRLLLCLALLLPVPAWSAVAYQAQSAIAGFATGTTQDVTVTLPAHAAGDVFLLLAMVRDVDDSLAVSGWTQLAGSPWDRGTSVRYWAWWLRAASAAEANPLCDFSTSTGDRYCFVVSFRGAIGTGDPWEVNGTKTTGTADPSSATTITTLTGNALVVVAAVGEDNNNASCIVTGTDPAAYTEHYDETTIGADMCHCVSEFNRTAAGATGTVSIDYNTAVPVGTGGFLLSLKPPDVTRKITIIDGD